MVLLSTSIMAENIFNICKLQTPIPPHPSLKTLHYPWIVLSSYVIFAGYFIAQWAEQRQVIRLNNGIHRTTRKPKWYTQWCCPKWNTRANSLGPLLVSSSCVNLQSHIRARWLTMEWSTLIVHMVFRKESFLQID